MNANPVYERGSSASWAAIFDRYDIYQHDFNAEPFLISSKEIRDACQHFPLVSQREVRLLCKQDTRESRPQLFKDKSLFILPVRNGRYAIIKGEGYVDVPTITSDVEMYRSDFPFALETVNIGNSEMQYLDRAYALSLIRYFTNDNSLVLTVRGRKYTPLFQFIAGGFSIQAKGVQTEVDAGYEGENQVVLVEAKRERTNDTIIRQLYYPFRQWQTHTNKPVSTLFFQHTDANEYHLWHFGFDDQKDYNSIRLINSGRYKINQPGGGL